MALMLLLSACANAPPVSVITKDCVGDFQIEPTLEELDIMQAAGLLALGMRIDDHDEGYAKDCLGNQP